MRIIVMDPKNETWEDENPNYVKYRESLPLVLNLLEKGRNNLKRVRPMRQYSTFIADEYGGLAVPFYGLPYFDE